MKLLESSYRYHFFPTWWFVQLFPSGALLRLLSYHSQHKCTVVHVRRARGKRYCCVQPLLKLRQRFGLKLLGIRLTVR